MSRRRRKNPDNWMSTLLIVGAVGFVAYLLWQKLSGAAASVGAATTSAGNSVGTSLFNLFNPSANPTQVANAASIPPGSVTSPGQVYYTAVFPDGSSHAIDASTVMSDGSFTYNGTAYILAQGSAGANAAYPASSVVASS